MRGLAVGGGLLALVIGVGLIAYLAFGSKSPGGNSTPGVIETSLNARTYAVAEIALAQVRSRIQQHQALNGRYPASLDELAKSGPLPALPPGMAYEYNPATGAVEAR